MNLNKDVFILLCADAEAKMQGGIKNFITFANL